MWVSTGNTESGDSLPVLLWGEEKPNRDEVAAAYMRLCPTEFDEVGFVNFDIEKAIRVR